MQIILNSTYGRSSERVGYHTILDQQSLADLFALWSMNPTAKALHKADIGTGDNVASWSLAIDVNKKGVVVLRNANGNRFTSYSKIVEELSNLVPPGQRDNWRNTWFTRQASLETGAVSKSVSFIQSISQT